MNTNQDPTDRFLIQQYLKGNKSVLPLLVKRYHKIFCQKAFWITKDKGLAKDVAQDSWITIIDKLKSLKNTDSFKSWALRIVYTKAVDKLKNRTKENKNFDLNKTEAVFQKFGDDNSAVVKWKLLKAFRDLPKGKQEIIRLFYTEEYSIYEISNFLKIPVGTVKSRLFKAREKLKIIMKNNKL